MRGNEIADEEENGHDYVLGNRNDIGPSDLNVMPINELVCDALTNCIPPQEPECPSIRRHSSRCGQNQHQL